MKVLALMIAVCASAQGASASRVMLDVPRTLREEALETSVVCRDAHGKWSGAVAWKALEARTPILSAGNECRVLLRRAGGAEYLASGVIREVDRSRPLAFQPQWLRTVRAGPSSSQPYWVGGGPGAVCMRTPQSTSCMFIPIDDSGALVTVEESGVRFALSAARGPHDWAEWRVAPWGRLVRVRAPAPREWAARVVVREPALKHGRSLLQQPRLSRAAFVHRLGETALWVEGGEPEAEARLEMSGRGAAPASIALSSVRDSPLTTLDITLAPEEVIEGDVRENGRLIGDATVSLFRFLARPSRGPGEEERRPMEPAGETRTDATGRFRFDGLAPGDYELAVSHSRRGRARLAVRASSIHRITLVPPSLVRGRVVTAGVPVGGATVTVTPSYEAVLAARNPAMLIGESVQTGVDGRFEIATPDEGVLTLTALRQGAAVRIALGDARALPATVELGDVRLDDALEVVMLLELPPTCVVSGAGPIGQPGLMLQRAQWVAPGRWILRTALEGRWLIEASCDGTDVPLDVSTIEVSRRNRELVRLSPRREPARCASPLYFYI